LMEHSTALEHAPTTDFPADPAQRMPCRHGK
jgi:hypothetical protein